MGNALNEFSSMCYMQVNKALALVRVGAGRQVMVWNIVCRARPNMANRMGACYLWTIFCSFLTMASSS